jgi:hypothetical protein
MTTNDGGPAMPGDDDLYISRELLLAAFEGDEPIFKKIRAMILAFPSRALPAATPRPMGEAPRDVDLAAIERSGNRWHGEYQRKVRVRWEPYKPDGQRQMKAKGRWQEQQGSGDYWRWVNCERPEGVHFLPHPAAPEDKP